MSRIELVQHILRPLDRACNQLRVEHHIQGIYSKMPLSFLISPVYFYSIAHGLECMERQADGQEHVQVRYMVLPPERRGNARNIGVEKVVVFKYGKYANVRDQAENEVLSFSRFLLLIFQKDPGEIVYYDCEKEDKDILRLEEHVEET